MGDAYFERQLPYALQLYVDKPEFQQGVLGAVSAFVRDGRVVKFTPIQVGERQYLLATYSIRKEGARSAVIMTDIKSSNDDPMRINEPDRLMPASFVFAMLDWICVVAPTGLRPLVKSPLLDIDILAVFEQYVLALNSLHALGYIHGNLDESKFFLQQHSGIYVLWGFEHGIPRQRGIDDDLYRNQTNMPPLEMRDALVPPEGKNVAWYDVEVDWWMAGLMLAAMFYGPEVYAHATSPDPESVDFMRRLRAGEGSTRFKNMIANLLAHEPEAPSRGATRYQPKRWGFAEVAQEIKRLHEIIMQEYAEADAPGEGVRVRVL